MTHSTTTTGVGAEPQLAEAQLRLPRPPGVIRRVLAAHPRLLDGGIVFWYLIGCGFAALLDVLLYLSEGALEFPAGAEPVASAGPIYLSLPWLLVTLAVTGIVATSLAFRRRHPVLGVLLVSATLALDLGLQVLPNSIALVFLLYAAPVYRSVVAGWIAYAIAVVTHALVLLLSSVVPSGALGPGSTVQVNAVAHSPGEYLVVSAATAVWLLVVLLVGINRGNRMRYVEALIDRARQLAVEREQQAQLAAAAERARIAREMHDIVAHSLSVVVTLSEAAAVTIDRQPEAARQAMERAAETGRGALTEMRRLLGVLGDEGHDAQAPLAPQPGAAQLAELVAGFRDAGLAVSLTEVGVAGGDAMQQVALYRIVQEGLTNALRYAGRGSRVAVSLEHAADRTLVDLRDSGPPAAGRVPDGVRERARRGTVDSGAATVGIPGTGRGLAGARQRAELFGGTLEAGPYGSGWRVRAEVPYEARPDTRAKEQA